MKEVTELAGVMRHKHQRGSSFLPGTVVRHSSNAEMTRVCRREHTVDYSRSSRTGVDGSQLGMEEGQTEGSQLQSKASRQRAHHKRWEDQSAHSQRL